jgi:hypothetical protein
MDANEHKYYYINSCLFVFIRGFPYPYFLFPLFSFLFPISGLKVLVTEDRNINELKY